MKILFLCSSIESGKDGVGDYTKHLCGALIKKGHQVAIVALCDKHIEGLVKETIILGDFSFIVTRISINSLQTQRFAWTQETIRALNPDWVSLQFVPYGFNPKGLPFWLPFFLNRLKGKFLWHIMFHELWIGRKKNVAFKNKVISYLQQVIIKQLLKKMKPQVIHTHLPVYKDNLEKLTSNIIPLPLFSNINPPINFSQNISGNNFRFAFFSQVDITTEIIHFINVFNVGLKELGFFPELIIIGGNENMMSGYIEEFKKKCPLLTTVTCTGFLDDNEISIELKNCNIGITPIPRHALGKSGSTAAFLAHGIPVAVPIIAKEYSEEGIGFFDKNWGGAIITNPNVNEIKNAQKIAQSYKHMFTVEQIGTFFINDLW
ncbi:glycosyltransferase [Flavobacterium ovatum]|uniref:glycosyltransferase n=1 Tax=Flavobacterium ovatum TaxID=1928857 RepID=UPI00344DC1A2